MRLKLTAADHLQEITYGMSVLGKARLLQREFGTAMANYAAK
jgi:hypothetical protein